VPNDPMLTRALAVLAKADSTTYEEERSALVYGGYVLLARYLAANPTPPDPEGRPRERRLVADRRRRAARAVPAPRPDPRAAYLPGPDVGSGSGGLLDTAI
jgi:hypothetical protein